MAVLIAFVLGIAISTATLTLSMVVFGKWWQIDFGAAKTAIAKGAGLILAVNLIAMIPLGAVIAVIILTTWFVGLMVLFQLRFVEAFVLTLVNFVVNFGLSWLLRSVLT